MPDMQNCRAGTVGRHRHIGGRSVGGGRPAPVWHPSSATSARLPGDAPAACPACHGVSAVVCISSRQAACAVLAPHRQVVVKLLVLHLMA
jgi:hypothetical protein